MNTHIYTIRDEDDKIVQQNSFKKKDKIDGAFAMIMLPQYFQFSQACHDEGQTNARLIFDYFINEMDQNNIINTTSKVISVKTNIQLRTVRNALTFLIEKGYIAETDKIGAMYTFIICPKVAIKSGKKSQEQITLLWNKAKGITNE